MPTSIQVINVTEDHEFDAIYQIRRKVFVEEQGVPEDEEYDEYEHLSHHYLAVYEGVAVGTARWRATLTGDFKLERFAVLAPYRDKGIGAAILAAVLKDVPRLAGKKIYLHAQLAAQNFYTRHGFEPEGEIFSECDILHIKMKYANN